MNSKDLGVNITELTNFERGVQQGRSDPLGTVASWFTPNGSANGSNVKSSAAEKSTKPSKSSPLDTVELRPFKLILEKIINDTPLTADDKNFLKNIYNKI
jgi:hypothetical protein